MNTWWAFTVGLGLLLGAEPVQLGVVVQRDVPVKMRDGVTLRADVHRPDRGGP